MASVPADIRLRQPVLGAEKALDQRFLRFQKIRIGSEHHDTVPYPDTLEEAKEFVVKYKHFALSEESGDSNT